MKTFEQISVGEIFFEGETGEYYIKKSEKSSWVYMIDEDREYVDSDGQPMQCEFPQNHQVEEI